ncbi:MAG: hypothetical protein AAB653_03020 [Patescibacteria group bacterium]
MKFRQALFRDTDTKNIDTKKNAQYIIERILDFGNINEASWVLKYYPKTVIKKVMRLPRVQLSDKSKALWSLLIK